jgi:hypothetical protein
MPVLAAGFAEGIDLVKESHFGDAPVRRIDPFVGDVVVGE